MFAKYILKRATNVKAMSIFDSPCQESISQALAGQGSQESLLEGLKSHSYPHPSNRLGI